MKRFIPPRGERGAALLTVLLLVAVLGALAVAALERMRLATSLAINTAALDQARHFAIGMEALSVLTIADLAAASPDRTVDGGWQDQARQVPFPGGGTAEARVKDGGNCFNLNSLAKAEGEGGPLTANQSAVAQFANLMQVLEVPQGDAARIAAAAADWIDSDDAASPGGAEDSVYQQAEQPYRTANIAFADPSELRAVYGVTPEIYARVRPWICALPVHELSPININTLKPEQAPLLVMLAPGQIGLNAARQMLAERPAGGWSSVADFWSRFQNVMLPLDVQSQPQLKTRWFTLDLRIGLQGAELAETALVDAREAPVKVVARRWGNDE
jgi:general secretion pathway protein K